MSSTTDIATPTTTTSKTTTTTTNPRGGTLSERLHQARSNRRSFTPSTTGGSSKNQTTTNRTTAIMSSSSSSSSLSTTNTQPIVDSHNTNATDHVVPVASTVTTTTTTTTTTTGSTANSSSNGYHPQSFIPNADPSPPTVTINSTTAPSHIEGSGNSSSIIISTNTATTTGSSSNSSTTTGPTKTISQRYRTLPGFVTTSPQPTTTTAVQQRTTPTTTNNTTTTLSSSSPPITNGGIHRSSLGRYRPSSSIVKGGGGGVVATSSNDTSQLLAQMSTKLPANATATMTGSMMARTTPTPSNDKNVTPPQPPPRTWRNIHELVQKIESTDNNHHHHHHMPNTTTVLDPTSTTLPQQPSATVASSSLNSPPQQYQPRTYRNLHHTLTSTRNESKNDASSNSVTSNVTLTGRSTSVLQKSTTLAVTAPTTSPEPVMNRWKYKYNVNNNQHGTTTSDITSPTTTITTSNKKQPTLIREVNTTPQQQQPFKSSTRNAIATAPHTFVPPPAPSQQQQQQEQYSFVPSPTNGSNSIGSNGLKKKSYNMSHGGDEASSLSLVASHSFASSSQSSLSQLAPPDSQPIPSSRSLAVNDNKNNHTATMATTTTTNSPTASLSINNSRSFGSQPSLTKCPSTESVATTTAISTAPSWKSTATKKKNNIETTTNGPVVYGSPVPAWKKKLIEQQRLQQLEQEKALQSIPKWKQKQIQQQKLILEQQQTMNNDTSNNSGPVVAAATTSESIVTSPSDEGGIVDVANFEATVDHVIATALSNVAVINNDDPAAIVVMDPKKNPTFVSSHQQPQVTKQNSDRWSHQQQNNTNASKEMTSRPRLRLGASPETESFGSRGGINQHPVNTIAPAKSWFNKTHPSNGSSPIGPQKSDVMIGIDIVAAPSEDTTVSIPSPEKDDPAEQSGIGESTSLLSPRRRGEMTINTHNDSSVHNTNVGRSSTKQWESPRTARLEAMKANANTAPGSTYFSPGLVGKASPVVVSNHFMKSPDTTTPAAAKKWQPPKKETPIASIVSPVVVQMDVAKEDKNVPVNNDVPAKLVESTVAITERRSQKSNSSVAEMKAKLWGTGSTEKLVAVSKPIPASTFPTIGDTSNSYASPIRSNTYNDNVISMTPPKPTNSASKSATALPNNFTRGRPDVCTPNGPLPPPRSNGQDERPQLPPRRNLDTLWMNRIEQTNNESNVASPPHASNDTPPINPLTIELNPSDTTNDYGLSVNDNDVIYSEGIDDYVDELSHDSVQPPPPPPAERSSHHRSPSIGDFQVAANLSVKETVEDLSHEFVSSPPVSPRILRPSSDPVSPTIRPAVMTKWDDFPQPHQSGSISPTVRRLLPPKGPPISPVATEKKEKSKFSETIDCPPLDDSEKWGTDADITGPKELIDSVSTSLSPRPKQDRPWTKDANTLSPSIWIKPRGDPPEQLQSLTPTRPSRMDPPVSDVETTRDEKKTTDDVLFQAKSPSSLMRMAADSIHAIDYDKAVQGLQRRSIVDEDDESMLSAGTPGSAIPAVLPPEFEKAVCDTEGYEASMSHNLPVFGDPTSYGAAGDETVAKAPVRVADRAKALESWNGGLGVSPLRLPYSDSNPAPTLSPIKREESESDLEGMSPRISKRGFGLDDWKRTKSFDSKSDFETSSDFWQPSNLDNQSQVDERDWSRCDPDVESINLSRSDSLKNGVVTPGPEMTVTSTRGSERRAPPLLEKSKMDTDSRPKMTWKKKPLVPKPDGTSVPPRPVPKSNTVKARKSDISATSAPVQSGKSIPVQSTSANQTVTNFDPFDPFEFSFHAGDEKVEFTETTEFSDSVDFFNSQNTFTTTDPASFPAIQEKLAPVSTTVVAPTDLVASSNDDDDNEEREGGLYTDDEYLYDGEYPPSIAGLNPPSGSNLSQYEVWSYDADTSNLQDGAAEI